MPSPCRTINADDKTAEKELTATNEAIQAQQQLLQDLYPDQHSSQGTRNLAANRTRPRPRMYKTALKKVQQTSNLASTQAQLSELQKMFCKISDAVNVNKQVEQYAGVSFLDSKGFIKSR